MNFTESFDQFASKLSTMDLALYAGVGLVLWVLFKDKLSPVQKLVLDITKTVKGLLGAPQTPKETIVLPVVSKPGVVTEPEDVFFKLVVSWKQTRDLAVKSGCAEAVKVADQMFPFLSPNVCAKKQDTLS